MKSSPRFKIKHRSDKNRRMKQLQSHRRRTNTFFMDIRKNKKRGYPYVVVLTGAGISAESGIKTFRAADGLWEEHRIEDVATPEGFVNNPQLVHQFYNQRRKQLLDNKIKPNAAHYALAELEDKMCERFLLITQNIDNLHERAGNRRVIHMHGELLKMRCTHSGKVFPCEGDLTIHNHCSCCSPPAPLRPHIVWFGEMPLEMERINRAIQKADYFIAIGTSGSVYPAAGFVQQANEHDVYTVELNLEPSKGESAFKEKHYGLATEVVPKYLSHILDFKYCRIDYLY